MHRVALKSLLHDRGRAIAAIVGVAFATNLFLFQAGTYQGFVDIAVSLIDKLGGQVWVMPKGTVVLDIPERMSASSEILARSNPCVADARGLIFWWAYPRKPTGAAIQPVQIVGFTPPKNVYIPWSMGEGLPADLHGPDRITVDDFDLKKLGIKGEPLGQSLDLNLNSNSGTASIAMHIAATTHGIRSFTLAPYLFTELSNARRFFGIPEDQADYWILDLKDPSCINSVIETINRSPDLEAVPSAAWRARTEKYWVIDSGIGVMVATAAFLGLLVGIVIVAQTLYSIAQSHLRELGTLKALGALNREVIGFVAWQAFYIAVAGGAIGITFALLGARAMERMLLVEITPGLILVGAVTNLVVCAFASLLSIRRVMRYEPAEVFR